MPRSVAVLHSEDGRPVGVSVRPVRFHPNGVQAAACLKVGAAATLTLILILAVLALARANHQRDHAILD